MLKSLSVNNYAIINNLEIEFCTGLNIITGETGAGKSILLGALSLLLGQRADTSVLKKNDNKCVVEGVFNINGFDLKALFNENDIDYDDHTIIRREIAVNGKSRAFVNDIPVNLNVLKDIGLNLIDIHSQHENLNLQDNNFQIKVVDTLAENEHLRQSFTTELRKYKALKKKLEEHTDQIDKLKADKEYFEFQYNELNSAALKEGELEELEEEYKALSHAEELKEYLGQSAGILSGDEMNVLQSLKDVSTAMQKVKQLMSSAGLVSDRIESSYIEIKDIEQEITTLYEKIAHDPERMEFVNSRINLMYALQQKHHVKLVSDLIELRESFRKKLDDVLLSDEKSDELKKQINRSMENLRDLSGKITESRKTVIPSIEDEVNRLLSDLGMPYSTFRINLEPLNDFQALGSDRIQFLYSPGKDISFQDLAKTASGGEISRLMLSIKSIITRFIKLPTIIFDEIDTGVSGDIADKMGNIIKKMSTRMQVINITHLPQVASKGDNHYLVHKVNENNVTETKMKLLNSDERVNEVAKMLSGADVSDAAIQNAKELLKG